MNAKPLFFVLVAACGTDGGGEMVSTPDSGPSPDGVPPSEVRFQRDVVPIFNKSCGTANDACHNRKPFAANQMFDCRGWLSLENAAIGAMIYAGDRAGESTGCPDMPLHYRITQLAPWQCSPTSRYIAPGDVASSYIIDKIKGVDLCPDGNVPSKQMPPSDSTFTISAQDLATLEAWIEAGAKND